MNQLIIKIESGVVADIWHSGPFDVTVVDYDVIEGGDDLDARMRKAVLSLPSGQPIPAKGAQALVESLVAACERPVPRRLGDGVTKKQAA